MRPLIVLVIRLERMVEATQSEVNRTQSFGAAFEGGGSDGCALYWQNSAHLVPSLAVSALSDFQSSTASTLPLDPGARPRPPATPAG